MPGLWLGCAVCGGSDRLGEREKVRLGIGRSKKERHAAWKAHAEEVIAETVSDFDKRVKQLVAQGNTTPMAKALAKQELGL